jgi:hypothetical protein
MDLQTISIGLVAIALCVLPILYLQSIRKKEREKLLNCFLSVVAQREITVSSFDLWDPFFAIGIDLNKKQLVYSSDCTYHDCTVQIDLTTVDKCTVEKVSNQVNDNMVIDAIVLKIWGRNKAKLQEVTLVFYQKEISLNLRNELQLAEKWKSIIDDCLQAIKLEDLAPGAVNRMPALMG